MVLWEITLATAYFLGLRRTYRLGLKIQRKILGTKYPRIRQFTQRRTRDVFDVALKVYRNIQERDIEVGRNMGNTILRWLDRMKPSAEIRPKTIQDGSVKTNTTKSFTNSSHQATPANFKKSNARGVDRESDRHFFTSSRNIWRKSFPSVAMMMQPTKPAGTNTQYRHLSMYGPQALKVNCGGYNYGVRRDIMQWMLQH